MVYLKKKFFLLVDGPIRLRTNNFGSGAYRPKIIRILRKRIWFGSGKLPESVFLARNIQILATSTFSVVVPVLFIGFFVKFDKNVAKIPFSN
jgi:hypothetical protein